MGGLCRVPTERDGQGDSVCSVALPVLVVVGAHGC